MKKLFALALLFSVVLFFAGCSDDEVTPPAATYKISGTITDASGNFLATVKVRLTGGKTDSTTTDATGKYSFTGLESGLSFTVTPVTPDFDFEPINKQTSNLSSDVTLDFAAKDGITGLWVSAGTNVAPLLDIIFAASGGVDTIYAEFFANKSYTVKQINGDASVLNYTGTISNAKSTVGNIYTIITNQSTPSAATSEGIYEIDRTQNPHFMQYEIVLTSGTQNVPPTPEAGFGSTNGGALGTINIQKYVRVR
ncbi:MAG TPA: hypothetical protein DHV28_07285 [Ignavibacteriales bacterium]|nr:hypothetical protein [Ignavibacteriales bacterium]